MANFTSMARRLQGAINEKFGQKILLNRTQWYSEEENRPVTLFVVKKSIFDAERKRSYQIELFSTYSQIHLVLFLRDYWYELNGWEIPTDNDTYQKQKRAYIEKKAGEGKYGKENIKTNNKENIPKKQKI